MRIYGLLCSLLLASLALTEPARACSCVPNPPPGEALEAFDFVFAGEVRQIDRIDEGFGYLQVTLWVERPFKGFYVETVKVNTATNSAACGFPFEQGGRYIVYAHTSEDGSVWASLCSRTARLEDARDDLTAFDALDLLDDKDDDGGGRRRCGGLTNASTAQAALFVFFVAVLQRRRRAGKKFGVRR